jgi:uncharacterized protein (DUF427 family)
MSISIVEKQSDHVLARGEEGEQVIKYEGNWYFDPARVDQSTLHVTERTYTCPVKGVCHWVDYKGNDGRVVKDVAWVYADPKKGHEAIKGRFAFYAGAKGGTKQVS